MTYERSYEGVTAETIRLQGHHGDWIDAYLARPLGSGPWPAVVMIHHMPGWDEHSREMARRFATRGFIAILPDLHFREGKGDPSANAASVRDAGGMPDERTLGDVDGAKAHLRHLANWSGKVGLIGYCSGGRQAYLAACRLKGFDAAVNCYGGRFVCPPEQLTERQPVAPIAYTETLACPLLGLFGNDDSNPSPKDVDALESELKRQNKVYEFHRFDGAGHAFFTVDRALYRPAAATAGWKVVFAFFDRTLR